ncbi:MAG: hypothetical protein GY820_27615, partial [Gammaproteobacteria bacterium]|nr:hypothetical protein [Gammaproteobacteria bacterium]
RSWGDERLGATIYGGGGEAWQPHVAGGQLPRVWATGGDIYRALRLPPERTNVSSDERGVEREMRQPYRRRVIHLRCDIDFVCVCFYVSLVCVRVCGCLYRLCVHRMRLL